MTDLMHASARNWIAEHLGVTEARKEQLYVDVSRSATLSDATYWLQILFAAGIATIGLTLNSAAVIIGAMLISPLMGPILAAGLALAAGDLVLGLRSATNLVLSCIVAVAFALLLVALLPFKEMTAEIEARTQPNTLDLVVALFSGAVGSVSTCKEVKGVATSIPGVAIAVALMPPLCVLGYGLGIATSVDVQEGMQVAGGGGLLFLTNLVAIVLMATLVFVVLRIDTKGVRERVRDWQNSDRESEWLRSVIGKLHAPKGTRTIGSLPGRLLVIILPLVLILIPLSKSFDQLTAQIKRKQEENRISRVTRDLWQQSFARLPGGAPRSFIDQLDVSETADKLALYIRVFTSMPVAPAEKTNWLQSLASRLGRAPESIDPQLVEIPLTSSQLAAKAAQEKRLESPPTVAELHGRLIQSVSRSLTGLRLPAPAQMVDYKLNTVEAGPISIAINYISERDISEDARALISEDLRTRFAFGELYLSVHRVPSRLGPIRFARNGTVLPRSCTQMLEDVTKALNEHPSLRLQIVSTAETNERERIAEERAQSLLLQLATKLQDLANRTETVTTTGAERGILLVLKSRGSEAG